MALGWRLVCFVSSAWAVGGLASASGASNVQCEPVKIELCLNMGYNDTGMPNLAENKLQADAKYELETFAPLIHTGCSPELTFFLCSVYAPVCASDSKGILPQRLIGPCRPLCNRVRTKCLPLLKEASFGWPEVLNCTKFPETNEHDHLCMEGHGASSGSSSPSVPTSLFNTLQSNPFFMEKVKEQVANARGPDSSSSASSSSSGQHRLANNYKSYVDLIERRGPPPHAGQAEESEACIGFKAHHKFHFVSRLNRCVQECDADVIFKTEDKSFVEIWMTALAALSTTITVCVLVTFLVSPELAYPQRSLLFLAFCCFGLALGYVLRLIFGKASAACQTLDNQGGDREEVHLLTIEGHRNSYCVIEFLFLYYFTLAVASWWTATLLAWLLSITFVPQLRMRGRGKSPVLSRLISLYHAWGWGLPAVLTVFALVTHRIEADELSGSCFVGAQSDDDALLKLIILPEMAQLVVSAVLFVSVIVVTFCVGSRSQVDDKAVVESLRARSLWTKMVPFAILCFLAKLFWLATVLYEYVLRADWLSSSSDQWPRVEMFVIRICMNLAIGMSCCLPAWSDESKKAWSSIFRAALPCSWAKEKHPESRPPSFPGVAYQKQGQSEAVCRLPQ